MNTIQELYGSKFICFAWLDKNDREAQIKAVEYIERMGALTNTNLEEVNLFEVFGNAQVKDKLITEKREINKRLHELSTSDIKKRELTDSEQTMLLKVSKQARDIRRS